MLQPKARKFTVAEYFAMEADADYKSEFHDGEIFDMAGASVRHNMIVSNIITSLNNRLTNRDCFVFPGDTRIQAEYERHYTYPDISVVCGDIALLNGRDDTITNPVAIIEVLSESTKDYDRGSKFRDYRKIATLREYLLVDQYSCSVEHFFINEQGKWSLEEYETLVSESFISSLGITLPLSDIYRRVKI